MLDRLRQSLALRLALHYALLFTLGSGLLFGALYWQLAQSLLARELAALEKQTRALAEAVDRAPGDFVARVQNNPSPEMAAAFVRLVAPDGVVAFQKFPADWVETQVKAVQLGPFTVNQPVQTVRIPQNELRDYSIATYRWTGGATTGWQLQVGRLMDSQAVLLAPLRKAFALTGAGALVLAFAAGTLLAWRATRPLRLVSDTVQIGRAHV